MMRNILFIFDNIDARGALYLLRSCELMVIPMLPKICSAGHEKQGLSCFHPREDGPDSRMTNDNARRFEMGHEI